MGHPVAELGDQADAFGLLCKTFMLCSGTEIKLGDRCGPGTGIGRGGSGASDFVGCDLGEKAAQSRILGSSLHAVAGGYWSRIARRVARAEEARPG